MTQNDKFVIITYSIDYNHGTILNFLYKLNPSNNPVIYTIILVIVTNVLSISSIVVILLSSLYQ